jgi:acyl-CoA thioesterase FadM
MRLRFRILWLILTSFLKKPIVITDETILNLRVLPNDIDITKITSDRYSALMDLGRLDYVFRCGLRNVMVKNKWIPIATFQTLRFRYPLKIFQKYQLKTKVIWWDDTIFYWEHIFERKGRIVATGHVCATLIDKSGIVPSKGIVDIVGPGVIKPDMPEIAAKLSDAENLIHKTQKE